MSEASSDVLVVGGGPAGSTTARLLARAGWRVVLLDRAAFPRAKACGECLNPGAVGLLARLGVLDRMLALSPARLVGWRVEAAGWVATGAFPDGERGLSLPRARLDHALLETAADAGVDLRLGIRVNGGRDAPLGRSDHPPRARSARGVRSSGPAGRPAPWSRAWWWERTGCARPWPAASGRIAARPDSGRCR